MRAVVTRVREASVTIEGRVNGAIGQGFLVLLGVGPNDTEAICDKLAVKICNLRVFEDENGRMHRSLEQVGGSLLVVSQFTLYADTSSRRPGFTGAAKPDRAKKALRYSVVTSLCISVFVFYFNFFHGDLQAGIFDNDSAVILEAADYLKAYAIDCLLTSFLFCFVGYFSGLGKTVFVMAQGILGAFGVRIPVSFFMSRLPNVRLFYIGLATPCSTVVQVLLCLAYYAHLSRREKAGPAV